MEPATRQLSHNSTKSILEREFVVALDRDGPMVASTIDAHSMDLLTRVTSIRKPAIQQSKNTSEKKVIQDDLPNDALPTKPTSISRKHRRCGFLPSSDDGSDPLSYSETKKTCILLVVATAGSISPISSSIYYPALTTIQNYFDASSTAVNASLSIFTFFTAFFPLLWATLGELFGRRRVYLISFMISVVGSICCALSVNITMFIVFRAFAAIGSSSVMSMGAGTLADIFEQHERGRAFAWYTCGPLLGPALGPIIGGYLTQGLGWRSNFWFLAIFGFCIWLAILIFLPETWRPAPAPVNHDTVSEKSQDTLPPVHHRRWINPLSPLTLFKFPNISLCISYISIIFFTLYLVNTSFTWTYTNQYGLDSGIVGLCYLPMAIGCMIGGIFGGRWSDRIYNKRVEMAKNESNPEMRLGGPLFYVAVLLQLVAFVAYGWCVQENVHWAVGLVFQFILGIGLMFPNVILSTYIVDCFRTRSSSVTACNNFARYILAGVGALIASDLQLALGDGILFTLCGCLLVIFSGATVIVMVKSKSWCLLRERATAM